MGEDFLKCQCIICETILEISEHHMGDLTILKFPSILGRNIKTISHYC